MPSVGFIGAGQIGGPMVARLLASRFQVRLFARREETGRTYGDLGATITDSIGAVALGADVVIACLYDDDQLRSTTLGAAGVLAHMAPGSVLVSHTTGLPRTLEEIADAAASRSVTVVDASFSGAAVDVEAGRLTIMLGGDEKAAQTIQPVLSAYADTIIRTGARGSALRAKLINNLLFTANAQLAAEALRLGDLLDLDRATLLDVLAASSGGTAFISRLRTFPDAQAMFDRVTPYLTKDHAALCAMADDLGIDLGVAGDVVQNGLLDLSPGQQLGPT